MQEDTQQAPVAASSRQLGVSFAALFWIFAGSVETAYRVIEDPRHGWSRVPVSVAIIFAAPLCFLDVRASFGLGPL